MKVLWNKTKYWNSVVCRPDGKIIITSMVNGKRRGILCDSKEDILASQKRLTDKRVKWVMVVPDRDCIFKEVSLPAADFDEATKMLKYELAGLVPIESNELVFSCYEISRDGGSYKLCVCVIKKGILDDYYEFLKRININPDRVLIHSLAIKEACLDGKEFTVLSANDNTLVSVRYTPNNMPLSRYYDVISQSNFLTKISDALFDSDTEDKLILALPENLREEVFGQYATLDPECLSAKELGCEDADIMSSLISKGAVSICNNEKYANFNLIPENELKKRTRKKTISAYSLNAASAAILVLLIWLNFWLGNVRLNREIDYIDRQIAPIKDVAIEVDAKKIQLNAIKDQISSKGGIIKILDDFYGFTPRNISLNELVIEHSGKGLRVQIKGQAQDHASAFGYTQALKNAVYIGDLNIGVGHMIPRPGGESIVEFGAECLISEGVNVR